MASSTPVKPVEDELIFSWRIRRLRRWGLLFFLLVSISLHALGLYLIRVVHPKGAQRPSRPVAVTLLVPGEPEVTQLLQQIAGRTPLFQSSLEEVRPRVALEDHGSHFRPSFADWTPQLGEWGGRVVRDELPLLHLPGQRSLPGIGEPRKAAVPVAPVAPKTLSSLGARVLPGAEFVDRMPASGIPLPHIIEAVTEEHSEASFFIGVDPAGQIRHCLAADEMDPAVVDACRLQLLGLYLKPASKPSEEGVMWGRVRVRWASPLEKLGGEA